jgi:hypothetical protein
MKVIKERTMFHKLPPFPEVHTLDTKKLIKSTSRLPSNKLQHVTEFFGNGGKMEHSGTDTFVGCMKGDQKAWATNKKYNIHDVDINYADFLDMLPYVKLNNNQKAFGDGIRCKNPTCLSLHVTKSKKRKVVGGYKMQYQCQECGSYTTASKLETKAIEYADENIQNRGHKKYQR